MVERPKKKAMATRRQRARGGISLFSKEEENYKSDTGNETDPDQAGDYVNPLQL